jgi:bifunctional DNA primase/polymerase-like protein
MIDSTPILTENTNRSLQDWRRRYEDLGMVTIPLVGKSPLDPVSWKATPPVEQWLQVGSEFTGNIGIVMGYGRAVIDADDFETANLIDFGLKSLGCNPPTVLSPHGKHFHIGIADAPEEFNWSRLINEVYSGELRVRNSYVVAPCSRVDGVVYHWEKGTPEDLKPQTMVKWKDLLWLLPEQPVISMIEELPIRLLYRDMPRKAKDLLEKLRGAPKGQAIGKYPSRSDAEAAVITMLILAGWLYDQILNVFVEWAPGKFHEAKGRDKQRYFDRTYYRAISKLAAHPTRQEIAEAWIAGHSYPYWPGGSGYLERDTYLGLLAICWQFGNWKVGASERDLAEYAAASQPGIHHALENLVKRGIIQKQSFVRNLDEANNWKVSPLRDVSSQVMIYDSFLREDIPDLAELWSPTKLGRSAGTVYLLLGELPVSVGRLARGTGKAWGTVKAALKRLEEVNLAIKLEHGWLRGSGNLREIAKKFETSKSAIRRHSYHKRQRELFAELLSKRQNPERSK